MGRERGANAKWGKGACKAVIWRACRLSLPVIMKKIMSCIMLLVQT